MGLELLLPILVEKVVGLLSKPDVAQEAAKMVVDNPEMATGGVGIVFAAAIFILRKFLKSENKLLKFRAGFVKVFSCVESVYLYMKDFKEYMKKKCIGGVCELPEEKDQSENKGN